MKILPAINGKTDGAERQRLIDDFKATDGFNALILSPAAAGVGFTITEANNVIHLERMWNPAKENQATDRVYRIGQKNPSTFTCRSSSIKICAAKLSTRTSTRC